MTRLRPAVYEAILDVLLSAVESDSSRPFPEPVIEALRRAVPCDALAYREWTGREGIVERSMVADDLAERFRVWRHYYLYRQDDPLPGGHHRPDRPNPLPPPEAAGRPLALADVTSERRFRQTGLYWEVCRPFAIRDVLKLSLPNERDRGSQFVFDKSGETFTEQDREVLRRLFPFFVHLRRNARLRAAAAAASGRLRALTPRELVVLGRAASGETNEQIAAALFVAPSTVAKHLEHVYEKLEVRNRAAATALYVAASE